MLKCIGKQNLIIIDHVVQEYLLTMTGHTDARRSLVFVLYTSVKTIKNCISKQNLMKIFHAVHDFRACSLKELNRPKFCSAKPRHRSAYQGLENVKIHKYIKFDPNIPHGSSVMSIFIKRA